MKLIQLNVNISIEGKYLMSIRHKMTT